MHPFQNVMPFQVQSLLESSCTIKYLPNSDHWLSSKPTGETKDLRRESCVIGNSVGLHFERSSKMFQGFFFFFLFLFSRPRSMTELFLCMALRRGGCNMPRQDCATALISQRPCWFLVILCCMIYILCQFWMFCFVLFFSRREMYMYSLCSVL